jgi:aldehyde:ferredoxin oxidoreductase
MECTKIYTGDYMHGYTGTILEINLSTQKVSQKPVSEKDAQKFIGGKGLGAKLLLDTI